MKILLLEDDILLNEIICEHLESKNYNVTSIFNGDEAQDLLYSQTFDLLLFDVNVPNINGFDLLEDIRSKDIQTPAIFITSLDMIDDVEKGFKVGGNDYIRKPFELRELDIRIENIKRMFNIAPDSLIEISSNKYLDRKNLLIKIDEKSLHIAQKECDVLEYLIKNSNKFVSIDELSLNVWAYDDAPIASTIRTYIKNLRKILGEDSIINTRGIGYRFNKQWKKDFF